MNYIKCLFITYRNFYVNLGIVWSKGNWINVFIKILYLVSGTYLILYALYLSNILLVIHKS